MLVRRASFVDVKDRECTPMQWSRMVWALHGLRSIQPHLHRVVHFWRVTALERRIHACEMRSE